MSKYMELIERIAITHGVDPQLLHAIMVVESNCMKDAVRYEPDYKYATVKINEMARLNRITEDTEVILQKCSWGLGQVMGGVARELGYTGPLQGLCNPEIGLNYCAANLKKLWLRYKTDRDDQIAAYNAGSAIKKDGEYINQQYVDKVKAVLKRLRDDRNIKG